MASGRKNYFRHSSTAFEDEKIQIAIEKLGYEGYAYYFILIELLARKCENEFKNPIRIHQQSLRNVWRKQSKSCIKVVRKLEESGLFLATFNENFIDFDIPNLAKYMGRYTIKNPPNTPNKSKIKEKKVKEKKEKEMEPEVPKIPIKKISDQIMELWNMGANKLDLPKIKVLNAERKRKLDKALSEFKTIEDWKRIFNVASTKGFERDGQEPFIPNWDYIFRNGNYLKFYEEYEILFKPQSKENLQDEIEKNLLEGLS